MAKRRISKKMRGGGDGDSLTTLLIVVLIAVLAFIGYQIYKLTNRPVTFADRVVSRETQPPPPINLRIEGGGGDGRYNMAPKPLRFWRNGPDLDTWNPTTLPSMATRGLPESFQAIGLLNYPGGELKPLYGRRTAGSSDRWNYYTRTDTYNPVPVPLSQGRRECMEDVGCNEVFDGDSLTSINGESVKVKLYKTNGPTYIPAI